MLYLLLTALYLAHVCEEAIGRFLMVGILGGVPQFLMVNAIFLTVIIIIFFYMLRDRRVGYVAALVYTVLIIINGAGHIIGWLVTGRYHGGFAGVYTGTGYLIIGPWLLYYLRKVIPKHEA